MSLPPLLWQLQQHVTLCTVTIWYIYNPQQETVNPAVFLHINKGAVVSVPPALLLHLMETHTHTHSICPWFTDNTVIFLSPRFTVMDPPEGFVASEVCYIDQVVLRHLEYLTKWGRGAALGERRDALQRSRPRTCAHRWRQSSCFVPPGNSGWCSRRREREREQRAGWEQAAGRASHVSQVCTDTTTEKHGAKWRKCLRQARLGAPGLDTGERTESCGVS